MKTLFILFCSILLATMVALSQSGPMTIMIRSGTQPASAAKGEAGVDADLFEGDVVKLISDKYPCAQLLTGLGVGMVLDYKRQQELLGADVDLKSLAGAVGAKYFISLTVTDLGSGRVGLNASMTDTATAQTQAKTSQVTSGGEAALDAVEAVAKQFVDSLSSLAQFSTSNCNPTNPWAGTITYHLVQNSPEAKSEDKAIGGDGKGTVTKTMKSSVNDDVTIRIGWTGQPRATIIANEWLDTEEIGKVRNDCGRPTIAQHPPEWKSAGWDYVTHTDHNAGETVGATVSVELANGRYRIKPYVPEIQGKTKITLRKHNDGGCGKPNDDNPEPVQVPWELMIPLPVIDNFLGKPNELKGSDTDASGGIITWNLTRTPMRKQDRQSARALQKSTASAP